MRLENIVKVFSIVIIALIMTGCGGGSSGGDASTPPTATPPPETTPPVVSSPFDKAKEIYDGEKLSGVGKYTGSGLNYVDFTMAQDGNIIRDVPSNLGVSTLSVKIYDMNLNMLVDIMRNGTPEYLDAGDYVMYIDFDKAGGEVILKTSF